MPDYKVKEMSDQELFQHIASWKPNSWQYIEGMNELRRRNEQHSLVIAWIAIGISVVALLLSVLFHFVK